MAVQFTGLLDQYLSQSLNLSSAYPWSTAMWINPSSNLSAIQAYASVGHPSLISYFSALNQFGTAEAISITSGVGSNSVTALLPPVVGSWNHIAAVFFSPSSVTLYLNGVPTTATGTPNTPAGVTTTVLGALYKSGTPTDFYTGSLAYPAFWNLYALTLTDVTQLYNNGAGFDPSKMQSASQNSFSEFSIATQFLDRITGFNWVNNNGVSIVSDPFSLTAVISTVCTTASLNITTFLEAYANRIPEDVYDSLEDQTDFVYVPYGPSIT